MSTLMLETGTFTIPKSVRDLSSFRAWVHQPDFPEKQRVWWLRNDVWIDMSKEQVFSHVGVKQELSRVLGNIVVESDLGMFLPDGLLLTNVEAQLSGNPDATFISFESQTAGRVELVEGTNAGFTEIVGSPDMVLEVVSDSSERKDFVLLFEDYFVAGISEYWRVDARQSPPVFEIFRRGPKGYVAVRKQAGWLKSTVFGRSFRLLEAKDRLANPIYRLEVR